MPASEARIAAARANGAKSRGPVTPEGKAISSRNSYKHGMAGSGAVLPPSESAEVERRSAAMMAEMAPRTEMGRFLVDRLAELTVRVQRCARAERAAMEHRAAHAAEAFDEARLAEADHAFSYIGAEPATHARKLRSTPEGLDRMIAALAEMLEEVRCRRWDRHSGMMLSDLTGRRYMEQPAHRVRALTEAAVGAFDLLMPGEAEGLDFDGRRAWAKGELAALVADELAAHRELREAVDWGRIEEDRAGAAERSGFDPSREAILARRYEAAAEREVYRALRELRRVEVEAAEAEAVAAGVEAGGVPAGVPEGGPEPGPLGSSGAGVARDAGPSRGPAVPASPMAHASIRPAGERPVEAPGPVGPAVGGPG